MTRYYLHTGQDQAATAELLAEFIKQKILERKPSSAPFRIAISGGNTPNALFFLLAERYKDQLPWKDIHFFWVDERCVPPEDPESNFGTAKRLLLDPVSVPHRNIFRIKGENIPEQEVKRYEDIIKHEVPLLNHSPSFDLVLLGMGNDGHTASIFPDRLENLELTDVVTLASHPVTKQKRITLTGKTLCNAKQVAFFVTGADKAEIVKNILEESPERIFYPAWYIRSIDNEVLLFLDKAAASNLQNTHNL